MRKYQEKKANELREVYQSKNPLRYYQMAVMLGNKTYTPSSREMRIISNQINAMFKAAAETLGTAMRNVAATIRGAAEALAEMAEAMKPKQIPVKYSGRTYKVKVRNEQV